MDKTLAKDWTCDDVKQWLNENNFSGYVNLLCEEHFVDGEALLVLTENDLRQPPLQIPILGDIKRLGIALRRLRHSNNINNSFDSQNFDDTHQHSSDFDTNADNSFTAYGDNMNNYYTGAVLHKRQTTNMTTMNGHVAQYTNGSVINTNGILRHQPIINDMTDGRPVTTCHSNLPAEPWKTLLSFIYVFTVFWITAFVMVIVHDRVPDMDKYPPLPDLFLDNMPYVPWAFECCEVIAVILMMMWFTILCLHKHRFILMRRLFSLTGTVFMLRSITMLITSMSVPGIHLNCQGKMHGDLWSKLERTLVIWRGFGMSLQGVRSCGDYMFSGHTVVITMLNFFITEYTPQVQMYYLHTVSWVLNLFGIFFILAAHEHYSIDVFIAFYITSRLFLYYHTLANNRNFIADVKRTKIWFPLFSFFESKCNGAVPNEFEWPLPTLEVVKVYLSDVKKVVTESLSTGT